MLLRCTEQLTRHSAHAHRHFLLYLALFLQIGGGAGWMDGAVYEGRAGHMEKGEWGGVEAKRAGRVPWGGCAPGVVNMQVAYFRTAE